MSPKKIKERWKKFKKRARKRGIDVSITIQEFISIKQSNRYYYTGRFLTKTPYLPYSNTIDRIDNKKGYSKENSVPCCHLFNMKKSAFEGKGFSKDKCIILTKKEMHKKTKSVKS